MNLRSTDVTSHWSEGRLHMNLHTVKLVVREAERQAWPGSSHLDTAALAAAAAS